MAARCIKEACFIIILVLLTINECKVQNVRYKSLGRVFSKITKVLNELNGEVLICNFNSDEQILDQIALSLRGEVLFEMRNFKGNQKSLTLDRSALLVFSDIESIVDFNANVELTNKSPQKFTFSVYCELCSVGDLLTLRETKLDVPLAEKSKDIYNPGINYWDRTEIIHFQYFIIEDQLERFVRLLTFEWYSPGSCNVQKLDEINRFDKTTRKWKTSSFAIANKFHNFHGCKLVFGVWNGEPLHVMGVGFEKDKTVRYSGFHYHMIIGLQRNLNFTASFNPYGYRENEGHVYYYRDVKVDMFLLIDCFNIHNYQNVFVTQPYEFEGHFMAVPPGESYTGYEKLLLPYDLEVWVLIILTFVTAFGTIFILRFAPAKVRDLIIGRHVRTPSLNVGRLFCGITQMEVPGRNFSRFLVMIFILYSLIIRTAWQSKMFEFCQKEMLKPELKSIYELMDNNYTLYMMDDFKHKFNGSDIASYDHIPDFTRREYAEVAFEKIFNSSCKCGVHLPYHNFIQFVTKSRGEILKRLLKEQFMFEACGMEIPRNHKFFDVFNLKTQQLFVGGIFDMLRSKRMVGSYMDPEYYKEPMLLTKEYLEDIYPKSFPEGPQVLTLEHLEAGFVIWLASLSFAFLGFALEWIRNCIEYQLFKLIIDSFYSHKRLEARRNKRSVEARVKLAFVNISKEEEKENIREAKDEACEPSLLMKTFAKVTQSSQVEVVVEIHREELFFVEQSYIEAIMDEIISNAMGCESNLIMKTSATVTKSSQAETEIVVEIHRSEMLVKQSSIDDIMEEILSLDTLANLAITDKLELEISIGDLELP